MVRQLELRRHARRDPLADRLSPEGRAQAEDVGREAPFAYAVVFVSPAERSAETAAWMLRGAGQQLPEHAVIPGLGGGAGPDGASVAAMAAGVRALLDRVPEGARGLAVSHTPLVERAAEGLTGQAVAPMSECEGLLITIDDAQEIQIEELRLGTPGPR